MSASSKPGPTYWVQQDGSVICEWPDASVTILSADEWEAWNVVLEPGEVFYAETKPNTSDIPETGEGWFAKARLVLPKKDTA